MSKQIILRIVGKYDPQPEMNEALEMLFGDAPRMLPANIPDWAHSWYEAVLIEDGQELALETGLHEREAIERLYLELNRHTVDLMLETAKIERREL